MNYYVVLGISIGATQDEVRQAYLRLAKMYHPDKNSSPDSTAIMAEINLAYETLQDTQRRKKYDLENNIAAKDKTLQEFFERYEESEDEEIGKDEELSREFGKCAMCNFENNSGRFVCSVCGSVFDPDTKRRKRQDSGFDELTDAKEDDALSVIIRCPRCNEINKFSSGSCWQCKLQFEIEEVL